MQSSSHPQAEKLDTLVSAACSARRDAIRGMLFCSRSGLALVNAAFDLFECDALYDLASDVRGELAIDDEACPLDDQGEAAAGARRR
ncbi:MAG: hypothetical protein JWN69_1596 [Alphaproteobacteria bacterium]|nr:hypothetical protein [Alphaproteobacteria bacterium]